MFSSCFASLPSSDLAEARATFFSPRSLFRWRGYQRITDRIVADLEQGVRSWLKPWNAGHMAGRITRPLR